MEDLVDTPMLALIPGAVMSPAAGLPFTQHVTCTGNDQHPTPCTLTLSDATYELAAEIAKDHPELEERAGNLGMLAVLHVHGARLSVFFAREDVMALTNSPQTNRWIVSRVRVGTFYSYIYI
jgi:hypothetical protein